MHRKILGFTKVMKLPKARPVSGREVVAFNVQHVPFRSLLEDTADPAYGFIELCIVHRLILSALPKLDTIVLACSII